jgi:hypothetical protein
MVAETARNDPSPQSETLPIPIQVTMMATKMQSVEDE